MAVILSLSAMEQTTDLKEFNTFGISAKARKLVKIKSLEEAREFFRKGIKEKLLILGGGSNILLRNDFDGIVVLNEIKGVELLREDEDHYWIKANAGENWHEFVLYCIEKGYAGLENLSLIPGKVGASPMQNIGAYGVEVKDLITEVNAVSRKDGSLRSFSNEECKFDYRSSIFKTSQRDQYFITSVVFRLNKVPHYKISYGAIKDELEAMGITEDQLSIKAVSDAVINIRSSKLPDPKKIGNSGSFFKNPVVSEEEYLQLANQFPDLPAYPWKSNQKKLAAGWLIEKAGWKGYREENYGVHDKQALVLVNHGGANGQEIFDLSERILRSVKEKFGVELEREVNII